MADFSERIASAGERDACVLDVDSLADAMHVIVPGSDDGELQSMALKINDIIQDECQLHKKILVPRLYTKIRRRTGLQSTAALQIIEYLEKNHLIKDNSTLLKSTLMENGRRKVKRVGDSITIGQRSDAIHRGFVGEGKARRWRYERSPRDS